MQTCYVTIRLAQLRQHSACDGGLKMYHAWKREMGRGRKPLRILWSPLAMVLGLSHPDADIRGYVRWLIYAGLLPMWSLRGANLNGADLTRAYLYGANLNGANLYRADLRGANLYRADLTRANLDGADLTRAYLSGADLTRANLNGADLTRAYLYGAKLGGANLNGASLNGANLTRAYYPVGDVPSGWVRGENGYLNRA